MTNEVDEMSAGSRGSHAELRERFAAADAMLRKLERTNLDAVPAAIAQAEQATKSSPTDNARATAGCGSDRTDKPAPRPAKGTGNTLTPNEREALEIAVEYVGSAYAVEHHAKTIRGLLERLK